MFGLAAPIASRTRSARSWSALLVAELGPDQFQVAFGLVPGREACVGEELISVRISQHCPVSAEGNCLWALALNFRNAFSVAVALGELVDNMPSYLPDSLVVVFREEAAESYRIASSPTSPWGDEMA